MKNKEREPIALPPDIIEHLDLGIKSLVVAFNNIGIPTYSSCEGHTDSSVRNRKLPYPWVSFNSDVLKKPQISKLNNIIKKWNKSNPSTQWQLSTTEEQISRFEFRELYFITPEIINYELDPELLQKQQKQTEELAKLIKN